MGIVYLLADPDDDRRYVGETSKELTCRLFEHMAGAFAPAKRSSINTSKNEWLREIFARGKLPIASILEEIHDSGDPLIDKTRRVGRETHFIMTLKMQGLHVMNANRGAVLVEWWKRKTPEERRLSARKSVNARTPEQRRESAQRGKDRQTAERRAEIGRKISATLQSLPAEERSRRAKLREENRRKKKLNE